MIYSSFLKKVHTSIDLTQHIDKINVDISAECWISSVIFGDFFTFRKSTMTVGSSGNCVSWRFVRFVIILIYKYLFDNSRLLTVHETWNFQVTLQTNDYMYACILYCNISITICWKSYWLYPHKWYTRGRNGQNFKNILNNNSLIQEGKWKNNF